LIRPESSRNWEANLPGRKRGGGGAVEASKIMNEVKFVRA